MTGAELEDELDAIVERAEAAGLERSLVDRLRQLGAAPEHWRPMRAHMNRLLEARSPVSERLEELCEVVRAVCPPGPDWIHDTTFAGDAAVSSLFQRWVPGPKAIARRSLCLAAVLVRCYIEDPALVSSELPPARGAEQAKAIWRWLEREKLVDELSPQERSWLDEPIGTWSKDTSRLVSRRVEALGVLLWAIGRIESIPEMEHGFHPSAVMEAVPLAEPTTEFVERAESRSANDIETVLRSAEFWHWRAKQTVRGKRLLPSFVRDAVSDAVARGHIGAALEGDLPVFGKPCFKISEEEEARLQATSYERHFALVWLTGHSQEWDRTPTET